jgi:hypothetical protein
MAAVVERVARFASLYIFKLDYQFVRSLSDQLSLDPRGQRAKWQEKERGDKNHLELILYFTMMMVRGFLFRSTLLAGRCLGTSVFVYYLDINSGGDELVT